MQQRSSDKAWKDTFIPYDEDLKTPRQSTLIYHPDRKRQPQINNRQPPRLPSTRNKPQTHTPSQNTPHPSRHRPHHRSTSNTHHHANYSHKSDCIQGHEWERSEGAVGVGHGKVLDLRGGGEGEPGLATDQELEREEGGEDVRG